MGASLEVTVNITNTGKRRATEVAQLYIRDVTGSITRPVRELKGFKHVVLEAGETRTVGFFVVPEDLKFVNNKLMEVIEPGDFEIWVGPNAQSGLKTGFEFK